MNRPALLAVALLATVGCSTPLSSPVQPAQRPANAPTQTASPSGGLPAQARLASVRLESAGAGFRQPLGIVHAGDGSKRLFVVEKQGTIRVLRNGRADQTPFLDITNIVGSDSSERGLLGLAFHPKYAGNGLFFVNYTDKRGNTVVARYRASGDRADTASALTVLTIDQPFPNHNGGNLAFGPDGYLYIGTGDGGSGGDPNGNGQNANTLLGKMLRIDIDAREPYAVPPSNPFVNRAGIRPEIWAVGLRNPWRYAFDRQTGDLYIGDVGQNAWEEINVQPARSRGGENYGWNRMEGLHCFQPRQNCDQTGLTLPVAEYANPADGCSVTGGHVYRGSAYPAMNGLYFFGDYCKGRVWSLRQEGGTWTKQVLLESGKTISSFGEDEDGEIYIAAIAEGAVYRLTPGG